MFAADLAAMLALSDARKAENAAARERCKANAELCAVLLADAARRGQSEIDWAEYFRNVGLS
jgi:hypothetical protein